MRVLLLGILVLSCGGDDEPPKRPSETFCARAYSCPNLTPLRSVEQCAVGWAALDSEPKECVDCALGLTCAGLAQIGDDRSGIYPLCPMCL